MTFNKFTLLLFVVLVAQLYASSENKTIYDFSAKDSDGNEVSFEKYR